MAQPLSAAAAPPACPAPRWRWLRAAIGLSAFGLGACAVELQNTQPAREIAPQASPAGSVYTGWRVFQDKCAACHGPAATGTAAAPDLLPRLRTMGPRSFVSLVLDRYDWSPAVGPRRDGGREREGLLDDIVQRRQGALTMPAWQDEPRIAAHIMDLYAWLAARSEGSQGPGRPPR